MDDNSLIVKATGENAPEYLKSFIFSENENDFLEAAKKLSEFLGGGKDFLKIAQCTTSEESQKAEAQLLNSFKKNLSLLIEKTWVEKFDEDKKEFILYKLEEFCANILQKKYRENYKKFFEIIDGVFFLMFGAHSKGNDFLEFMLRIDPGFGGFCWFVKNLPRENSFEKLSTEKIRLSLFLGMIFLANY